MGEPGPIVNIDLLRKRLREYYGDPLSTGISSPTSDYATDVRRVVAEGEAWLSAYQQDDERIKAVVFDIDDTILLTWSYVVASNWDFNASAQDEYITGQRFPAITAMLGLAQRVEREGYAIFYITGRSATEEQATLGNLTADGIGIDAGYPRPTVLVTGEDGLFTHPAVADYPEYLRLAAVAPDGVCTTAEYKTATRAYIESLGYHIVASFGDQFSDLEGGHAERTFQLPNPNYYLP